MSQIIQQIDPTADRSGDGSGSNSGLIPTYMQHNRELHSVLYQLLHTAIPPYPGEPGVPVTLVTNGLGCLPVVAEDGVYIVKND